MDGITRKTRGEIMPEYLKPISHSTPSPLPKFNMQCTNCHILHFNQHTFVVAWDDSTHVDVAARALREMWARIVDEEFGLK